MSKIRIKVISNPGKDEDCLKKDLKKLISTRNDLCIIKKNPAICIFIGNITNKDGWQDANLLYEAVKNGKLFQAYAKRNSKYENLARLLSRIN